MKKMLPMLFSCLVVTWTAVITVPVTSRRVGVDIIQPPDLLMCFVNDFRILCLIFIDPYLSNCSSSPNSYFFLMIQPFLLIKCSNFYCRNWESCKIKQIKFTNGYNPLPCLPSSSRSILIRGEAKINKYLQYAKYRRHRNF